MPELPEVETIRRQLNTKIVGTKILDVQWKTPKMLRPSPAIFTSATVGATITRVGRKAKLLLLQLDNDQTIAVHLKMNGRLFYRNQDSEPDSYVHVVLTLNQGSELRFADSRKFGYMHVLSTLEVINVIDAYGPEPLADLTLERFNSILKKTKRRVKDVLMDQKLIGGVGNIYANDSLWLARIHPESRSDLLSPEEIRELYSQLEIVLNESMALGGSSDHWYRHIDGGIGHYQDYFKVYGKKGKCCIRHPENAIQYSKVSQRGTFICSLCQIKKT